MQRATKLFVIASVWVTGLFVVIAAVTMVAVATAPIGRNSSADMTQQAATGSRGKPGPAHHVGTPRASAPAPARILAVYLGQGSANTSQFTVGGTGTWKLGWSFDCAGAGSRGTFAVSQNHPGQYGLGQYGPGSGRRAYVRKRGTAGHGVSWAYHDAGTHYLAIRTRCRWRLTVSSRPSATRPSASRP